MQRGPAQADCVVKLVLFPLRFALAVFRDRREEAILEALEGPAVAPRTFLQLVAGVFTCEMAQVILDGSNLDHSLCERALRQTGVKSLRVREGTAGAQTALQAGQAGESAVSKVHYK